MLSGKAMKEGMAIYLSFKRMLLVCDVQAVLVESV